MVPYSTHLCQWLALTGAKQHCFRTCRELVMRRWVWNQEKGNVKKKKKQKNKTPCTSSCPHTLWHPSHAAPTLTQVVKTLPTKKSKSFLKCICLFLKRLGKGGLSFGSGTCCWSIRCDLISVNERHPPPDGDSCKKLIKWGWNAHLPAVEVKFLLLLSSCTPPSLSASPTLSWHHLTRSLHALIHKQGKHLFSYERPLIWTRASGFSLHSTCTSPLVTNTNVALDRALSNTCKYFRHDLEKWWHCRSYKATPHQASP